MEFLTWQRDRVLAVAKGTATSATGFVTVVVVALLEQEIKADVPRCRVASWARPACWCSRRG
ncbi:hypothetical protein VA596_45440 [Amycolatopsis sp., V23-08]|uniref:Uncharacterized protein n=1 Tax=Amycolatopsis heterodermiae TaxID=3110235 RepID=A0ABU5RMM9_9PSEU|nr:hypothetical protein [Amycolatopsis sp., V23-08]MEA5366844.1 hypothetical protein [Amycolatopsis sp., V23-08]